MYQGSPILSLWNQITLESLTEKEAASMVQVLPELEQLKLSDIDQSVRKLKEYSFHLPQWVYLVIIIVSVLAIFGKHRDNHLEGLFNEGSFQRSQDSVGG